MIKLFFATFFIAELIIALAITFKLFQITQYVETLNALVLEHREQVKDLVAEFRLLLQYFNEYISNIKETIQKKRQEYILNSIKTSIIYGGRTFIKAKYKNAAFAFQIFKGVYSGIRES